ncbi:alpha/beta hydrolase [Bradyrhizobium sp. KB893862 SZCCT0404]|uniref:lipase family protein n=1 Tax=Bradyrhizobium sp. KB893862 SZCCT0404 TaxID=2807672 RepID=UPI001BA54F04|nr:lipase family protein [Bradyrhizobium sp. KB893862 SZCCT0404]MBR1175238.1 alpha/beta hydrolase [Bradyrhizobium sp. KB893862 SZCCT0404]
MKATLSLVIVALLGASQVQAASSPLPTGSQWGDQNLSPFYRWEQPLPSRPGVMLREEQMPAQAEVTKAALAHRILYSSTDVRWHAGIVPVSGSLYLPTGEPPTGGWPLVAWAHGTLGVADSCAPSWTGHKPRDATYINRWLESGFAVVATDYQGLGGPGPHPYLIWEAEGHSVLDAIRAALAAHADKLASKVFITGQSQGSGAALGATTVASSYAPDVPLLATVATGLVSTFPMGPYKPAAPFKVGSPIYLTLMLLGGSLPDEAAPVDKLVTDKGKLVLQAARESCTGEMRTIAQKQDVTGDNAYVEPIEKVEASIVPPTDMKPARLPVPLLLGTGLADHTLAPLRQYAAVSALCAAGNDVVWKTYPGITHNGGVNASFPDALAFFRDALQSRKPQSNNCASIAEPAAPTAAAPDIPFND